MYTEIYKALYNVEEKHWWFKGRRKILEALIKTFITKDKSRCLILDVGCSMGKTLNFLKKYGYVYGIDCNNEAVEFCHKQGLNNIAKGDACNLPFSNRSFDLMVALDLIEHLTDDGKALAEFNRVLKRNGHIIISVPAYRFLWSDFDKISEHHRRYNLKELRGKITQAGFEIKKISYVNCFLLFGILIYRMLEKLLLHCIKPVRNLSLPPKIVNRILEKIFSIEALCIKQFNFPFGSSIFSVSQKIQDMKSVF